METSLSPSLTVTVQQEIPLLKFVDLLNPAFDPVSRSQSTGYWCEIVRYETPPVLSFRSDPTEIYRYQDYPLNEGGALILKLTEPETEEETAREMRLDLDAIRRGASLMAEKSPTHWADFLRDNADIETGDVFVQFCVLGKIIYG